jgi:hypothetical protein
MICKVVGLPAGGVEDLALFRQNNTSLCRSVDWEMRRRQKSSLEARRCGVQHRTSEGIEVNRETHRQTEQHPQRATIVTKREPAQRSSRRLIALSSAA